MLIYIVIEKSFSLSGFFAKDSTESLNLNDLTFCIEWFPSFQFPSITNKPEKLAVNSIAYEHCFG